jgi:GH25 family lysozyme M1 (1,4-beta-N-acetylmuramidase)
MSGRPWGPDLSHHQGSVNFLELGHAGASFVMLKASEGEHFTDPTYRARHAAARAAGLFVGAYHFARPTLDLGSATRQADHFLEVIGALTPGDLPPVLDLEQTGHLRPGQVVHWSSMFLARVKARTGRTPILYTYSAFARDVLEHDAGADVLGAYPLWLARYTRRTPKPPAPWDRWAFWQHTDRARVPGVDGRCDRNVTDLSPAGLARLAGLHTPPAVDHSKVTGGTLTGGHVTHPAPHKPATRPAHPPAHPPRPVHHGPATVGRATVLGSRTLRRGSTGDDVKVVQRFVGAHPDGIYGPDTVREVVRYQRLLGLDPDGVVGRHTWAPILRALRQGAHRR